MDETFGTSDHCSIRFVDRDRMGQQVNILKWGKTNLDDIRQELTQGD